MNLWRRISGRPRTRQVGSSAPGVRSSTEGPREQENAACAEPSAGASSDDRTSIDRVGSDAYRAAHEAVVARCDSLWRAVEEPYGEIDLDTLRADAAELRDWSETGRVPAFDVTAVRAHLTLTELVIAVDQRTWGGDDPPDVAALAEVLVGCFQDRSDLFRLLVNALWRVGAGGVPLPDADRTRMARIARANARNLDGERTSTSLMCTAIVVDLAWTVVRQGRQLDPVSARSTVERCGLLLDEAMLGGAAGPDDRAHRLAFLHLQARYLLAVAEDVVLPIEELAEECDELRETVGTSSPLGSEVGLLRAAIEHGWSDWSPIPDWQAGPGTVPLTRLHDCRDAAAVARTIVRAADQVLAETGSRRHGADLARVRADFVDLWSFPAAGRPVVLFALALASRAAIAHSHHTGRGSSMFADYTLRQFFDGRLILINSRGVGIEEEAGVVRTCRPYLDLAGEASAQTVDELTAELALTMGRQQGELLDFAETSALTSGNLRGQMLNLSLAFLDYAAQQSRRDESRRLAERAGSELLRTVARANRLDYPVDMVHYLETAREALPWADEGGGRYALELGHLASGSLEHVREHSEQLTAYWSTGLADIRRDETWHPVTVVSALVNTAISINIHLRNEGHGPGVALQMANEAVALLAEARLVTHEVGDLVIHNDVRARMYAATSWLRYIRNRAAVSPEAIHTGLGWDQDCITPDVVHYQRLALDLVPVQPGQERVHTLNSIIDLLVHVGPETDAEAARRLNRTLVDYIAAEGSNLARCIEEVQVLDASGRRTGEGDLRSPALALLPRMKEIAGLPLPIAALRSLEGVVSRAAAAECRQGNLPNALELVEMGTGTLIEHGSGEPTFAYHDGATIVGALRGAADTFVHLVAGHDVGGAILTRDAELTFVECPGLTEEWIQELCGVLNTSGSADGRDVRSGALRAPEESSPPDVATLTGVLGRMLDVLEPLTAVLVAPERIDLVPVGRMSSLPWSAALRVGGFPQVALHGSFLASRRAASAPRREHRRDRGLAITSPDPSFVNGVRLPQLPGAASEGTFLSERFGAEHLSQGRAEVAAVRASLAQPHRFIHFAVHGYLTTHSWDSSYLVLAHPDWDGSTPTRRERDERDGSASAEIWMDEDNLLSLSDLLEVGTRAEVVFLAACWSASPLRTLPEEALSLPAAAVRVGARCVIAPLWPVEDLVIEEFVREFYAAWLGDDPRPVAEAFSRAVGHLERTFDDSTTWAAMTLHGAGFDT